VRDGAALLVYPGGDFESYRPTSRANRVDFGGRNGWVELALAEGAPVVPVVAIGGQETRRLDHRARRRKPVTDELAEQRRD